MDGFPGWKIEFHFQGIDLINNLTDDDQSLSFSLLARYDIGLTRFVSFLQDSWNKEKEEEEEGGLKFRSIKNQRG